MNDERLEKVGKNHVPTCPIFAGPVTYFYAGGQSITIIRGIIPLLFSCIKSCIKACLTLVYDSIQDDW